MNLLSNMASNAKTKKQLQELKIEGAILYLEPSAIICPAASPGCLSACLKSAGRMRFDGPVKVRAARTRFILDSPTEFTDRLRKELRSLEQRALKKGFRPVSRLNGTSDLNWTDLIREFPSVQFYDYTKRISLFADVPANYDLTFSMSEINQVIALRMVKGGHRVAGVFKEVPEFWNGIEVIDGDAYDFRFLDKKGVIVGLKAKGLAKKDTSGFVLDNKGDLK